MFASLELIQVFMGETNIYLKIIGYKKLGRNKSVNS